MNVDFIVDQAGRAFIYCFLITGSCFFGFLVFQTSQGSAKAPASAFKKTKYAVLYIAIGFLVAQFMQFTKHPHNYSYIIIYSLEIIFPALVGLSYAISEDNPLTPKQREDRKKESQDAARKYSKRGGYE